jgi:hypothetical protein
MMAIKIRSEGDRGNFGSWQKLIIVTVHNFQTTDKKNIWLRVCGDQGCQIFLAATYQNGKKYTK